MSMQRIKCAKTNPKTSNIILSAKTSNIKDSKDMYNFLLSKGKHMDTILPAYTW